MKKTVLALTIILTLLASYTAVFADLATANPKIYLIGIPLEPTAPPSIGIYLPIYNKTYYSRNVFLKFGVTAPDEWFIDNDYFPILGNITSVYYVINGDKRQYVTMDNSNTSSFQKTLTISTILNLTAGAQNITVGVEAWSLYRVGIDIQGTIQENSIQACFTVELPKPAIVTPAGAVYNESNVPLTFTLNTPETSWVGYSLDGNGSVAIAGNTTLTGLHNGEHNITVFTNDTFGNVYASQPAYFTIAVPAVSVPFPTATVAAVSIAVAVACVGVILYLRKHKS